MKPAVRDRITASVLASTPCRGLSLSRYTYNSEPVSLVHVRVHAETLSPAAHHWATVTLKSTVFSPPLFVMTNLYFPSLSGVSFTEHFGPGESSFPTCLPAWS